MASKLKDSWMFMRGKMKKLILISFIATLLYGGCLFNYNGEAVVVVQNMGELIVVAQIEYGTSVINPGEEEIFDLTWPGHDEMHINLTTFPAGFPEAGDNLPFYINDGETRTFQVAYYQEDIDNL